MLGGKKKTMSNDGNFEKLCVNTTGKSDASPGSIRIQSQFPIVNAPLGTRPFQISLIRENDEHQQRSINKLRECAVGTVIHL